MAHMRASSPTFPLLLFFLFFCFDFSFSSSTHYRAAVVEHVPIFQKGQVSREQALEIMFSNLDIYEQHIQSAINLDSLPLDIILFPEDGLYGAYFYTRDEIFPYLEYLPDIPSNNSNSNSTKIIPCDFMKEQLEQSPILVRGSCLARKYKVTIVFNMGEVRLCDQALDSSCPKDGRYQYNTLVALSSSGEFVAKYHKSHLYYEPQFDQPSVPEVVWFDSDFGVRFGLTICFDLMFEEPQLSLYFQHGVRDFLWSSWWVNMPPLITGTQVELSRSWVLPSNFLASGIGLSWYNSGSGIYSNGKALQHWYNPTANPVERLLLASVPIFTNSGQNIPIITPVTLPESSQPSVVTFRIKPNTTHEVSATSDKLVCTARLRSNPESPEGELYGVYSLYGIYNNLFPAQICAVMRCLDDQCLQSVLTTSSLFDEFELEGTFNDGLVIVYPMVAQNYATLVAKELFLVDNNMKRIRSSDSLSEFNLLNAALFGLQAHHVY